tara:strand:+ start:437 stop:610 length:174 start_codon:yes stop_codon:yes gene_type:complete
MMAHHRWVKYYIYDNIFKIIFKIFIILIALEDLAMFRAIPNSIVLYPSDAISTEKAV